MAIQDESTPVNVGQDIVFPTLPHGLCHISEPIAVILAEMKKQYPEYEEQESNDTHPDG